MSWSEFVAFRNPQISSFAQFLLDDDAPVPRRALTARGARGYITARVRVPGAGRLRIAFLPPDGERVNTRGVFVAPR